MPRKTDEQRRVEAVDAAVMVFWASIARAYPEIKTGDLLPNDALSFATHADNVVHIWLETNKPHPATTEQVLHALQARLSDSRHLNRITYEYQGHIDVLVTPRLVMGFDESDGFRAILKDPGDEMMVLGAIDPRLGELELTDRYLIADTIIRIAGLHG